MIENVKRLFVFSNAYTARVLLRCCEYILPHRGLEIVLLSEIGVSKDLQANGINITVHTCESIPQCVSLCTEVLVVFEDGMSKTKINTIKDLASFQKKCYVTVNSFRNTQLSNIEKRKLEPSDKSVPRALLLSLNAQMQISCWEAAINKMLVDNGIRVFQDISEELKCVLEWLLLCNVIDTEFLDNRFFSVNNCDMFVKSIQYKMYEAYEMSKLISEIAPDIIIAVVESNYNNYIEIANVFKCRHNCSINIFAKSEFMEYIKENKRLVVFDEISGKDNVEAMINLNDPLLIERLSEAIMPMFSLPEGVMIM